MLNSIKFGCRLFWHESVERLTWKLAYLLPRKVALIAFVRVYSVTGECGPDYGPVYDAWVAGKGR